MHEQDKKATKKENVTKTDSAEATTENEVETLRTQITLLEDKLLRAVADAQNEQKRAEKEKADIAKYSIAEFARDVLTIRDNLQFALNSGIENSDAIIDGIKLTLSEMDKILMRYKVIAIESMGMKFDPHLHQAMVEVEDSEKESGTVVQVMQDGFMIHDRLLRPALVSVSKKCN
jgi:molecular chaperone GrpE